MLSVWQDRDPTPPPPDLIEKMMSQVGAVQAEMKAAGAWVFFGALTAADSATVGRAADGNVSMTDGPYAEAKSRSAASRLSKQPTSMKPSEWARKGSEACMGGAVEVRPFL